MAKRAAYCAGLYQGRSSGRLPGRTVSFTVTVSRVSISILFLSFTLYLIGKRLPEGSRAVTRGFLLFWEWEMTRLESGSRVISFSNFFSSFFSSSPSFFLEAEEVVARREVEENFLFTSRRKGTLL